MGAWRVPDRGACLFTATTVGLPARRGARSGLVLGGCVLFAALAGNAWAAEVTVAVAANFVPPLREIAAQFERTTEHQVQIVSGSSGTFYAQIKNGAPFDVFFSADQERPERLEAEGFGVRGSRFTYAVGRLVLWSPNPELVTGESTLREGRYTHLAMANPQLAPYGVAAVQVMKALGIWERLQPRIVLGGSLGQTAGFVVSGNAELGFIALSQALDPNLKSKGSRWEIPRDLYDPIRQDVVVTVHGASNPGARALVEYVRTDPGAHAVIGRFGYGIQ